MPMRMRWWRQTRQRQRQCRWQHSNFEKFCYKIPGIKTHTHTWISMSGCVWFCHGQWCILYTVNVYTNTYRHTFSTCKARFVQSTTFHRIEHAFRYSHTQTHIEWWDVLLTLYTTITESMFLGFQAHQHFSRSLSISNIFNWKFYFFVPLLYKHISQQIFASFRFISSFDERNKEIAQQTFGIFWHFQSNRWDGESVSFQSTKL